MRHDDGTFEEPYWGDEDGVITGFMNKIGFDYEVGGDLFGTEVYPTAEAVPTCGGQDGIVEVELRLKRVVEETNFDRSKAKAYKPGEAGKQMRKMQSEEEYKLYQKLRRKYDSKFRHYLKVTGRDKRDEEAT